MSHSDLTGSTPRPVLPPLAETLSFDKCNHLLQMQASCLLQGCFAMTVWRYSERKTLPNPSVFLTGKVQQICYGQSGTQEEPPATGAEVA
jgi:hypothetical protein